MPDKTVCARLNYFKLSVLSFFFPPAVQTQSPVLQGKMLVPMATVRAAPAPSQQFPLVAPPLPVQNGAQAGSKVRSEMGNTLNSQ